MKLEYKCYGKQMIRSFFERFFAINSFRLAKTPRNLCSHC